MAFILGIYIYILMQKKYENRTFCTNFFLKSDPRGKRLALLGSRKFATRPRLVPFGALAHKQKRHRRGSSWAMGPKKRPACIKVEPETPKKLKPEKAADLQQSKPVKAEQSSPARKTTAKQPEKGQQQESAEGEHQEPAQGHAKQQKGSLQAPSQSAWKGMRYQLQRLKKARKGESLLSQ